MGMAGDYIRAHEAMCNIVEKSFRKMAKHCEFNKEKPLAERYTRLSRTECHYPNGDNSGVCAREICPILEKE